MDINSCQICTSLHECIGKTYIHCDDSYINGVTFDGYNCYDEFICNCTDKVIKDVVSYSTDFDECSFIDEYELVTVNQIRFVIFLTIILWIFITVN